MKTLWIAIVATVVGTTANASSPPQVAQEPMYVSYPKEAFAARVEGRVAVELTVSAQGQVQNCAVVKGVDPSLDAASCRFWQRTLFYSAQDDRGQPVQAVVRKFSDWRLPYDHASPEI
jgi:TonB family protein